MSRIAAIMACHNRREGTLACLHGLHRQALPESVVLHVFLTDDGSSDGTADAVRSAYPEVTILSSEGNLFWNGGMRLAFGAALQQGYDYYLWLNDDTILYGDAIQNLLECHADVAGTPDREGIVVGTTRDGDTGQATYGGVVRYHRTKRLRFSLVVPEEHPVACETMNGNCVLIPGEIARNVGNLDPAFTHSIGDFDYGLRAQAQGYPIWVAPGFMGECSRNSMDESFNNRDLQLGERYRKLVGPKGLPPAEWKIFCRRYAGPAWPLYYCWPCLKLVYTAFVRRWCPD